jgi:hypothetical protein
MLTSIVADSGWGLSVRIAVLELIPVGEAGDGDRLSFGADGG